jgi:hypothetical protein
MRNVGIDRQKRDCQRQRGGDRETCTPEEEPEGPGAGPLDPGKAPPGFPQESGKTDLEVLQDVLENPLRSLPPFRPLTETVRLTLEVSRLIATAAPQHHSSPRAIQAVFSMRSNQGAKPPT